MSRSRHASPPSRARTALLVLVAVAVVTALFVGGAVVLGSGTDDKSATGAPSGSPSPSDSGTPLSALRTRRLAVARTGFCDAVSPVAVQRALVLSADSTAAIRTDSWENGQQARLETGLKDVAHEYGCSWRLRGGLRARAWVFAPPVGREQARALADSAPRAPGCGAVTDAPTYGAASVGVRCTSHGERTRSYRGLFGDAWLTCEVGEAASASSRGAASLEQRSDLWCSAVLAAARVEVTPSPSGP